MVDHVVQRHRECRWISHHAGADGIATEHGVGPQFIDGPDRSSLLGVGLSYDPRSGERGDRAPRLRQKYFTLAQIGAERDVCVILHARARSRATSAYASGPGSATFGFRTAIRTFSTSG